jgi:hypothetical protein
MSDYTLNGKTVDYYGPEMTARREKFNRIINGMDLILMNNIPEVDPSVWENWQDKSPMSQECEIEEKSGGKYLCVTHLKQVDADEYQCEDYEDSEVYQWYAVGDSDADYLKRHNQYITYSDMLDTYFLAVCHLGTSWDYVDSMVNDILGDE